MRIQKPEIECMAHFYRPNCRKAGTAGHGISACQQDAQRKLAHISDFADDTTYGGKHRALHRQRDNAPLPIDGHAAIGNFFKDETEEHCLLLLMLDDLHWMKGFVLHVYIPERYRASNANQKRAM
jgi:hypothetical protein